ncbi:MAG: QueT transporter family protein [Ruminococcaceae bacterium]|nr:QueT transporter family protein [Oscillospiraceae bacterium]
MNNKTRFLTYGSVIAALYVALTLLANALGLASGVIQVRLSEALTILPMFTPAAVPGLFVGCVLANLLTGCAPWDVVFGSLATLIGALGTWKLAKNKWIAPLFPILSNAIIVPFVLQYVYAFEGSYRYFFITVGLGEIVSCGVLGLLLYNALIKTSLFK